MATKQATKAELLALLVEVAKRNGGIDESGNRCCWYCGDFLQFSQRDGRAPGGHRADCLWVRVRAAVEAG